MTATKHDVKTRICRYLAACMLLVGVAFVPSCVFAQVTTGTLSGTVDDKDGARIPGAKVTVTNRGNKFSRTAPSNSEGIFSFAGLDSGDYTVTITSPTFEKYVTTVHLDPGDNRSVSNIKMVPGAQTDTITVTSENLNHVEDTGERSAVISAEDLKKLSLEGREVTELLKILPGSAINTGIGNNTAVSNSTFDPGQVGFGGASGAYSMSGSPVNGVAIRSDGANLTDPSSGAGGLQTINAEATAEVKVQTSNFGADNANGPLVISAVGKSGASEYHGSVYSYGRTGQLNSTDSIAKLLQNQKPPDRYIYPGMSIGGPVKIPGTDLNHNKHLTFFVSGEDYIQRNVYAYNSVGNAVTHALVPTAAMRKGDFSLPQIQSYLPPGIRQYACQTTPGKDCTELSTLTANSTNFADFIGPADDWNNLYQVPVSDATGGQITCQGRPGDCLAGHLDPGALAQFNLFPLPNTPGGITNALGYNYTHTDLVDSDIYELHGRLDYERGRSKFFLTYTNENGENNAPQAIGYFASGNNGGVNTPGGSLITTLSNSASLNWNIVLSATLNNEAFVNGLYNNQIASAAKPNLLFNQAIGYPYTGAYDTATKEFPSLNTYGYEGLPLGIFPDYSFGDLYQKTFSPGIGDNLSKQLKKHTVKVGVNVERPRISGALQNANGSQTNGSISQYYVGPQFTLPNLNTADGEPFTTWTSTCYTGPASNCTQTFGNSNNLANYLVGDIGSYSQANEIPRLRLHAWTPSFYITDDWKVLRNLSITAGIRIEHIGRWVDDHGFGSAVFIPSDYFAEKDNLNNPAVPLPGFRWHSIDSSIPISGFETRKLFYEPRVGFAWDVYGTSKTTLSGGYGQYRFRDGQADAINNVLASNGFRQVNPIPPADLQTGQENQGGIRMTWIQSLHLSPKPGVATSTFLSQGSSGYGTDSGATVYSADPTDSQAPLTTNYSLTLTQQLPKSYTFSIAYVGNYSQHLLDDDGNGPTVANINALPVGTLFRPDPNPESNYYGLVYTPSNDANSSIGQANDYRKYNRYTSIQEESHILTAHYDGMQMTLEHSKGALYLKANYTWSKNYGQRGGYSNGNAGDSFNLLNDYGPLAYDRSNIYNFSYNYDFGSNYRGYRALRPLVNGWQLSGITNLQSGPDLLATNYTTNFNFNGTLTDTAGGNPTFGLSNVTFLGTPDVNLQPLITCNPATGLAKRQFVNANCFSTPAQGGQNGPFRLPYLHGPMFFQSDLTAVKDFKVREKQQLEFRAAAFNFLNYKLKTFSNADPNELTLIYPLTNGNDAAFGRSVYNAGRRVMELSLKYTF